MTQKYVMGVGGAKLKAQNKELKFKRGAGETGEKNLHLGRLEKLGFFQSGNMKADGIKG